tara:strand:+ start:820 stop:981 length:162 start_codon:yes stop_codon:yes gene_type:complete
MIFNSSQGNIQVKVIEGFATEQECKNHADSAKLIMLQPKYANYACLPKREIVK